MPKQPGYSAKSSRLRRAVHTIVSLRSGLVADGRWVGASDFRQHLLIVGRDICEASQFHEHHELHSRLSLMRIGQSILEFLQIAWLDAAFFISDYPGGEVLRLHERA